MNFNTINGFVGGTGRNQIPLQTLATVTETAFTVNTDSGTGVTAIVGIPAGAGITGSESPLDVNANAAGLIQNSSLLIGRGVARPQFTSKAFDGRPFKVRLYGTGAAVTNAGNTLLLTLYSGTTSAVVGTAGNVVAVTSAVATATTHPLNFMLEATFLWDSTVQTLQGWYTYSINYNGTTTFVTTAALTHNTAVTTIASAKFLATATWGNAVGGTIQVNEFSVERV